MPGLLSLNCSTQVEKDTRGGIRSTSVSIVKQENNSESWRPYEVRSLMEENQEQLCWSLHGKQCLFGSILMDKEPVEEWGGLWCPSALLLALLAHHIQMCPSWEWTLGFTELSWVSNGYTRKPEEHSLLSVLSNEKVSVPNVWRKCLFSCTYPNIMIALCTIYL